MINSVIVRFFQGALGSSVSFTAFGELEREMEETKMMINYRIGHTKQEGLLG